MTEERIRRKKTRAQHTNWNALICLIFNISNSNSSNYLTSSTLRLDFLLYFRHYLSLVGLMKIIQIFFRYGRFSWSQKDLKSSVGESVERKSMTEEKLNHHSCDEARNWPTWQRRVYVSDCSDDFFSFIMSSAHFAGAARLLVPPPSFSLST